MPTQIGEVLRSIRVRNGISLREAAVRNRLTEAEYARVESRPEGFPLSRLSALFLSFSATGDDLLLFSELVAMQGRSPVEAPYFL